MPLLFKGHFLASLGWQGVIVGMVVALVTQALTLWGEEGLL